jgi:hypothetical protein
MKTKWLLCVVLASCMFGFAKDKADVRDVTGCLSKGDSPKEFLLTGTDGSTWEVRSSKVALREHVGHTITATGVVSNATAHNMGTGNAEGKTRERGNSVIKKNMTLQVREHVLRIGIILFGLGFLFFPGAPAKAVQALLGVGLGKTAGINSKLALQLHPFSEIAFLPAVRRLWRGS